MSNVPPPPGQPPTGPPAGGMPPGGTPPQPDNWDLSACVSYAWAKFQTNMVQLILGALVLLVGSAIILGVGFAVIAALTSTRQYVCDDAFTNCRWEGGTPFIVTMVLGGLVFLVFFLFAQIVGAGLIRGALGITEGREFQVAEVFKTDKLGPIVVTALIVAAATSVGYMLCYVPGIIIAFLTSYSLFFVIDKDLPPIEAIKSSFELITNNFGPTIIWYLIGGLIASAGAIACGIGIIFTLPIALLGTAYTYKKLTHQPIAA